MLELKKVAITGGLASGKTTFCQELQKLGAYYVSADQILHQILHQDSKIAKALKELLGNDVVADGVVDRTKIADIVFDSKEKLKQVEAILHPVIQAEIQKAYHCASQKRDYSLFVVEVPLLFEAHMEDWYDYTIAILTDESTAMLRYQQKIGKPLTDYTRRMQHQMLPTEKANRADFVVENKRSIQEFQENAKALFTALTQQQ